MTYEELAKAQDDDDRAFARAVRGRPRGGLDPVEEGRVLLAAMTQEGLSGDRLAEVLGCSVSWVNERVALVPAEEVVFEHLLDQSTLNSPAAQFIRNLPQVRARKEWADALAATVTPEDTERLIARIRRRLAGDEPEDLT